VAKGRNMLMVDDKQIKRYERDLKAFASRAYPFATRQTVNASAFKAREIAQGNVRANMVTRNKWTERSIQVDKTSTLNVQRQTAIVGSMADYMETQEFGGTEKSSSGKGVAIATSYSAGQEGQRPRTRLPRRPNKMAAIQLQKRRKKGTSRVQQNFIAVREAAASGTKFLYLDLGRRRGIFRVTGGKRKPKIKMVHDLTRSSVAIPKNPWLAPAVRDTERYMPEIYRDALVFQLQRNKLFR
jgi:hypothetical protein